MKPNHSEILAQLQKDILQLQGFKILEPEKDIHPGLGMINQSFPNSIFPIGAVHEFISAEPEDSAATSGFISGLLNTIMKKGGAVVWISSSRMLFPPALKIFELEPDRIIFVDLQQEKDIPWVMEEALKCGVLAAVVAEIRDLSFTTSRRFQLAVEKTRVTGFLLRRNLSAPNTIASIARWRITPLPSSTEAGMPGVGLPRWKVELLKIRNGKPGSWSIEWSAGRFRHIAEQEETLLLQEKRKTG